MDGRLDTQLMSNVSPIKVTRPTMAGTSQVDAQREAPFKPRHGSCSGDGVGNGVGIADAHGISHKMITAATPAIAHGSIRWMLIKT
jgi:hypothetical protein